MLSCELPKSPDNTHLLREVGRDIRDILRASGKSAALLKRQMQRTSSMGPDSAVMQEEVRKGKGGLEIRIPESKSGGGGSGGRGGGRGPGGLSPIKSPGGAAAAEEEEEEEEGQEMTVSRSKTAPAKVKFAGSDGAAR